MFSLVVVPIFALYWVDGLSGSVFFLSPVRFQSGSSAVSVFFFSVDVALIGVQSRFDSNELALFRVIWPQ